MRDQELCVPSDEEADALRRQSFFEGSVLTSSNSLVADHNSASTSEDKSVVQEDVYCFQNDHFGDEEDAVDMIGRVCHRQSRFLSKYFYSYRKTVKAVPKQLLSNINSVLLVVFIHIFFTRSMITQTLPSQICLKAIFHYFRIKGIKFMLKCLTI